ncbi:class I SAM-dependent methyltransferase [Kiloniella sp.]|uniref:class I SAM-dependent methyltransferase n=1 Tax=Kiloniella sp. TaxID=1938587 RepID=UPI003A93739E
MAHKLLRKLIRLPYIGRLILMYQRSKYPLKQYLVKGRVMVKWLIHSKEITNYTYDLTPLNKTHLAATLAEVLSRPYSEVWGFITELEADTDLALHISDATEKNEHSFVADKNVKFGRRLGWYVIARVIKPQVIVETGVDKGLGACILAAALKRNKADGFPGYYYGTDIYPKAGYLLSGKYADFGTVLYGDSLETLKAFEKTIDMFINDSDHSPSYEIQEYNAIKKNIRAKSVILSDNSQSTNELLNYSLQTNRNFLYFQEKPLDHWYNGAGIGISFKRNH